MEYGGFWRRLGAMIIDGLIFLPIAMAVLYWAAMRFVSARISSSLMAMTVAAAQRLASDRPTLAKAKDVGWGLLVCMATC